MGLATPELAEINRPIEYGAMFKIEQRQLERCWDLSYQQEKNRFLRSKRRNHKKVIKSI